MTCNSCVDLCVQFAIHQPYQLKQAIKIASENIADGTIFEILSPDGQMNFAKLVRDHWDDVFDCRFKCGSCGKEFSLHGETYHGGGGYWEPVNPEVGRPSR